VDTSIDCPLTRSGPVRGSAAMRGSVRIRRAAPWRRPWRVSAAGAIAAVTLHVMLLSAITLGADTGRPPRQKGHAATMEVSGADDRAISVLVVMDPRALYGDESIPLPALRGKPPVLEHFQLPHLVRLADVQPGLAGGDENSDSPKATATTAVDGAERAVLFGRYVSQINARIERLWIRPQSAPYGTTLWRTPYPRAASAEQNPESAVTFRCRVQILQSRNGEVLEVTLLDCDSSPKWQQSLVNAIDAASPLPAPPNEAVFARSLELDFTSTGRVP
jgi:TonB C terminal